MTRSPQFVRLCKLLKEKSRASADFNSLAFLMTQELCEWLHCEWGTFWQVDSGGSVLNPVASWREPSLPADKLLANTKRKRLQIDEGNAGIVWRTGQPKCVDNLVLEMCLPRSLEASEAGLRGGIWIPVRRKKAMLGVIEILGKHYWTNSEEFLHELKKIGIAVGEALEPINKS
jgi:hypothetical protein